MSLEEAIRTSALFCQLDDNFVMLHQHLERLGFTEDNAEEFKIFCSTAAAVEFFGLPNKEYYQGIKIVMVSEFPSQICTAIRSTEFVKEKES